SDDFELMLQLALPVERNHFTQVVVVSPEGTVIRVLTAHQRKQRYVDVVAHQPDRAVVCSRREKAESHLNHFRRAGAVDHSIQNGLTRELLELTADVVKRLVARADYVVRAQVPRRVELRQIACERDNG